jgi:hypothetical protein
MRKRDCDQLLAHFRPVPFNDVLGDERQNTCPRRGATSSSAPNRSRNSINTKNSRKFLESEQK